MAEAAREGIETLGLGNPKAGAPLTISIGCSTVNSEAGFLRGHEVLLREASMALESAKVSGRNCAQPFSAHAPAIER
jgi:GGDEF domain-containing protein